MKNYHSIGSAIAHLDFDAARSMISRWLASRSRRKRWSAPETVLNEFCQGVTNLADLRAFFEKTDAFSPAPEVIPSRIDGFCYVCQREQGFVVDTGLIRRDSNWRETLTCPGCGLINRWRSSIHVFEALVQPVPDDRIYVTEAVTPLFRTLASRHPGCIGSEYIAELPPGTETELPSGRVRVEDVTRLSFADRSFEAVLSFDVLEHVPDYVQALREFYRVLVPGGQALISVPFTFLDQTIIRAEIDSEGTIHHLQEPVYHGDPLSEGGVLCYQEFGLDFLDKLRGAGFQDAYLLCFTSRKWGYYGPHVMFVGRKQ